MIDRLGVPDRKPLHAKPFYSILIRMLSAPGVRISTRNTLGILASLCFYFAQPATLAAAQVSGQLTQWHPIQVDFYGPYANETDNNPNPFLDYRLIVEFNSPTGESYTVPGFFAGNGNGGGSGNVWRAIFSADQPGNWTYRANFRRDSNLAVELDTGRGTPVSFNGETGGFNVSGVDPSAPGFLRWGRLDYNGKHHLKFRNGPYWIKTGTDSPENFLAYAGFDGTEDRGGVRNGFLHYYEPHRQDARGDDPWFSSRDTGIDSRGITGALNYLSDQGVNSIYFLPMNLGGDGYDTHPFVSAEKNRYAKTHFDVSKLHQWNMVLNHAQRRGIALNVVLNETEIENREWQDDGNFGLERKLYYREMVARFGYLLAAKWNICEENNFTIDFVREAASYLNALDWSGKPVSVHTPPNRFDNYYSLLGNPDISATSIQYSIDRASDYTEEWRRRSRESGRPWIIDMDENDTGLLDRNTDDLRKRVLYDVLFSGGNIEWYFGFGGPSPGGDITVEDFRTRENMWRYSRIARQLLESHTAFQDMEPADEMVNGENQDFGGAEVLAKQGEYYAIYLPRADGAPRIDNPGNPSGGRWEISWYDPRSGDLASTEYRNPGASVALGAPPYSADADWVVMVKATGSPLDSPALPPAPQPSAPPQNQGNGLALAGVSDFSVSVGNTLEQRFEPSSGDGAIPSMFMSNAPEGSTFRDNRDGTRSLVWTPLANQAGSYSLSVTLTHPTDSNRTLERRFTIVVNGGTSAPVSTANPGSNPVLDVPSRIDANVGQPISLRIAPRNANGGVAGVYLSNQPASASFNDNGDGSRNFRWTPAATDRGIVTVQFVATDSNNASLVTSRQVTFDIR